MVYKLLHAGFDYWLIVLLLFYLFGGFNFVSIVLLWICVWSWLVLGVGFDVGCCVIDLNVVLDFICELNTVRFVIG